MNSQRRGFHYRPNVQATVEMGASTTNLFRFAGMNENVECDTDISPRLSPEMVILEEHQQSIASSHPSLCQPRKKSPPRVQRSKSEQTDRKEIKLPPLNVSSSPSIEKKNLKPSPPKPTKLSTPPPEHTNEDPVCETCHNDWQVRMIQEGEERQSSCTCTCSSSGTSRISLVPTSSCDDPLPPLPDDRNADWQLRMIQEGESRQSCTSASTSLLSNQTPVEMDQFEKLSTSSSRRPDRVRSRPTFHVPTERCRTRDLYSDDSGYWDVPVEHIPERANERGSRLKKTKESPIKMIEVEAGHAVPLKGSEETWNAFCRGKVIDTECISCQTFLYCDATANIVLCPCCRFLSHVDGGRDEGVGIGLTVEYVFERMSG